MTAEEQPACRLTAWLITHGAELLPAALGVCVGVALLGAAYLWMLTGAKTIAVVRIWWRFLEGLRFRHAGGTEGARGHSLEYQAVLQSAGRRRRRSQASAVPGAAARNVGPQGRWTSTS